MTQQPPYCIHCGARQLNADVKFCYRCGQPIVPVKPVKLARPPRPPWLGPAVASAIILAIAAILFLPLLIGERGDQGPAAGTPAPVAVALAPSAPGAAASPIARVTLTPTATAPAAPTATPLAPTATSTPMPTPTLVGITPDPVRLTRLAWSPDGKLLAVGSGTGVYLFDTATWREARFMPVQVNVPPRLEDAPRELAFSSDSAMLAAAIVRTVHVWRVADGALAYTIDGTPPLAASPTEGLWATFGPFSGASQGIHLWRTSDGQLMRTIPNALLHPNTMAFSPDGSLLAVESAPGDPPAVWQVADGRQVAQLNWPNAERYYWQSVAFHPNSTTVASAGSDIGLGVENVFVLWDARRGAVIREIIGQGAPSQEANIRKVCYTPDGGLLAAYFGDYSGRENRVELWSGDGAASSSWPLPGPAGDISFTPDGKLLAVAEAERIAFYDPAGGQLVRAVAVEWHQGILPTPTPTPLHVGLKVPADWVTYYNLDSHPGFKLMYPPTWKEWGGSVSLARFRKKSDSTIDAPRLVELEIVPGFSCDPASQVSVERIKKVRSQMINGGVFVTGGTWPYLIPAVFAEFEVQIESLWAEVMGIPGQSTVREIDLEWSYAADKCSSAKLTYSHELREQDRLDVSRMLASIEFEDETHRFPTATPTFTPTPNLAPRPALPLQLTLKAQKVRTGEWVTQEGVTRQWVSGHITIEVKDAYGQPTNGARVILIVKDQEVGLGFTREGRVETTIISETLFDEAKVEVYWDQELIAQQDIAVSWQ